MREIVVVDQKWGIGKNNDLLFSLPEDMAFFGEVGLTGEIRTVTQAARRIAEIEKMGFKRCMLPFDCLGSIDKCEGIKLIAVRTLSDALQYINE